MEETSQSLHKKRERINNKIFKNLELKEHNVKKLTFMDKFLRECQPKKDNFQNETYTEINTEPSEQKADHKLLQKIIDNYNSLNQEENEEDKLFSFYDLRMKYPEIVNIKNFTIKLDEENKEMKKINVDSLTKNFSDKSKFDCSFIIYPSTQNEEEIEDDNKKKKKRIKKHLKLNKFNKY